MQTASTPLPADARDAGAASRQADDGGQSRTTVITTAMQYSPPSSCARILIVGAGGFGREVVHWARAAWPAWTDRIAGFLAADPPGTGGHEVAGGILGAPDDYQPLPGDGLVLAIGLPVIRRRIAESLLSRGGRFLTLVHPTAIVAPTATIGAGSILCPFAIASDASRIGRFVLVNYHASLGHDARVDDYAVLSPYAALGGGAHVGEDAFLGLHAAVGPGRSLGARGKVTANSCLLTDAPADALVFGVPGRVVSRPPLGD